LRKFDWFMSFALPALGWRPIDEISAREVLTVPKEVEARGIHETARKLRKAIGDVFRYAIATVRAVKDPTIALRGALVTPTGRNSYEIYPTGWSSRVSSPAD
jgi:integrase